jgi:hypothetical protein
MSSKRARGALGQAAGHLLVDEVDHLLLQRRGPTVAGGCVWCFANGQQVVREALRLEAHAHHRRRTGLMVSGFGRVEEHHRRRVGRPPALVPILRSRLRMFIDTSPKSMFTGQATRALVAHGAVVGHVLELLPVLQADAAARLLLVEEGLDQQRGRQDLVARAVQQVGARHVRRAHRLALAAAQAVLDALADSSACRRR